VTAWAEGTGKRDPKQNPPACPVHPEFVGDGARRSRRFTVTQSKGIVIFPHLSLGHAEAA